MGRSETARERGASSVEYGLLILLIAAVITAGVGIFGLDVRSLFELVQERLEAAVSAP